MLNHYAQESKAKTERSGETIDLRLLPETIGSGERTGFLEHFSRKLKALDGWMLVHAPSTLLIKTFTAIDLDTTVFLLCITLTLPLINANLDRQWKP